MDSALRDPPSSAHDYADVLKAGAAVAESYGGGYVQYGPLDYSYAMEFDGPSAFGRQEFIELDQGVTLVVCRQYIAQPLAFEYKGSATFGVGFRLSGRFADSYADRPHLITDAGSVALGLHNSSVRWRRQIPSSQQLNAIFVVGATEQFLDFLSLSPEDLPPALSAAARGIREDYTHVAPFPREVASILSMFLDAPFSGKLRRTYLRAKAQELVCLAIQSASEDAVAPRARHLANLSLACEIMRKQPAHPHTLAELARQVGLSRTVLACAFKEAYGQTVYEYLTQVRMNRVRVLLREGTSTLDQIAQLVGYDNAFSLSRAYKRWSGTAPRKQ